MLDIGANPRDADRLAVLCADRGVPLDGHEQLDPVGHSDGGSYARFRAPVEENPNACGQGVDIELRNAAQSA